MDGLSEHQARAAELRHDRDAALATLQARLDATSGAAAAVERARTATTGDDQGEALRRAIAAQREADAALAASRHALLGAEGRLGQWIGTAEISDPRRRIEGLADRIPILLFPIRIETKFFGVGGRAAELRVRMFPDDVAIDMHAATLTEGEGKAGRQFWTDRAAAMQLGDAAAREHAIEGAWTRLVQDHGEQRGSFILIRLRPSNWDDAAPPLPADLVFPDIGPETPATVAGTVPRSRIMPDRFVVRTMQGDTVGHEVLGAPIPDDLLIGPDPKQLETVLVRDPATGRLSADERLAWLFDFDAAVKVGLAVRIPLEPQWLRTGFSRVIVLGLKLSADPAAGAALVERLIASHRYTAGFDILPQGTPTNNTERVPAGFSSDPRPTPTVYERIVQGKTATLAAKPADRSDAEYLAEALGIGFDAVKTLPNAPLMDIVQAFAMNRALWSATIGGYLDKIIPSAAPPAIDAAVRRFFLDHVTGRGTVPAIRVGRQPYGILVTSALAKWKPSDEEVRADRQFTPLLLQMLLRTYQFWRTLSDAVPRVRLDDADHAAFMAVVGLQASSAIYGARKGVTDYAAWNWLQFDGRWSPFSGLLWNRLRTGRRDALTRLGFDVNQADLKLAQIAFLRRFEPLDGPVIDGDPLLPLSEKATITPFDPATKQNYIHWLAASEPETIKAGTFKLKDGTTAPAPKALLYKYLRHALLAETASSAIKIAMPRIPALANLAAAPAEPDIVNVGATRVVTAPQMLGLNARRLGLTRGDRSLGGYIFDRARGVVTPDDPPELKLMADLVGALKRLADLPTAVLERLFAEHIDLGSYRLDAWITGLFDRRLRGLRGAKEQQAGVHIGAYGYVEDLKPKAERATEVDAASLPPELRADVPIVARASNGGFIHAPSLTHGITAAVLRNAYLSHADAANPGAMSINLSSRRVRLAMDYVSGIRNGQELGALLGYQLERGMHENHPGLELDESIYVLRDRFPFVSRKISPVPDGTAAEVTEARNVINGYDLLAWVSGKTYPYSIAGLPPAGGALAAAIVAEIDRLRDAMDSLGDVMMAESIHQVVQGNYDRARSVLQALGEGEVPPVPDVVATPRSGRMLVQRIALHLPEGAGWTGNPPATPRAAAAARLNRWLVQQLPAPATIGMTFTLAGATEPFSLADLGLDALDVVLMCAPSLGEGASVLERLIVDRYRATRNIAADVRLFYTVKDDPAVPDDKALIVDFAAAAPGGTALAAAWPLLNHLRELVARGRPLDASDYRPSTQKNFDRANPKGFDGTATALAGQAEYVQRVNDAIAQLLAATNALVAKLDDPVFKVRTDALFGEPPVFVAAEWIADLATVRTSLRRLVLFGLAEALPTSAVDPVAAADAETATRALVVQAQTVLDLARKRLAAANAAAAPPPVTPPPADPDAAAAAAAAAIQARIDRLGRALRDALAADMPLTPLFGLSAAAAAELAAGIANPIAPDALAVETWLQSLSRVRDSAATLAWVASEREWLLGNALAMVPVQTPRAASDPWIGGALGAATLPGDVLSVMVISPPADPTQPLAGLMIDDWSELVPGETETTGLAFHFDRPNASAPQVLLLAVSPTLDGAWDWSDLVAIVTETFDRARTRAVEPDQLVGTDYFHALPTTLVEFSSGRMYLSTVLANNALAVVAPNP